MSEHFEVMVVGAGPGGMAAATVAAEAGRRVCLIDDNAAAGGQIWRGFRSESAAKYPHGKSFIEWLRRFEASGCEVWQGWQVVDTPEAHVLRVECGGRVRDVGFEKLILATGGRERFLPFPGWTLPGVMGVGGMQALVKGGLEARGKRVVLAGSGPLLLAVGASLRRAGAKLIGMYEQAPLGRLARFGMGLVGHPGKIGEGLRYWRETFGVAYRTNAWVVRAEGDGRVERVTLTDGRRRWSVECDWLGCAFHLVPNLELARLLGCRVVDGFVAVDGWLRSSVEDVFCVGELTGIGGLEKALVEGQIAGWVAAGRENEARRLERRRVRLMEFAAGLERAFALRAELRALAEAETILCRCEDVGFGTIARCANWREAKLHTRCGMGACQGRVCGAAAEFLLGWEIVGGRPPVFPARVGTLVPDVSDGKEL